MKPQAKSVLTNTAVTLNVFVASASCPPDVEEIAATAKCYQITSLSNGLTPSVGLNSTPLGVFSGGSQYLNFTITPGVPSSLNLSFPSSTAGMQTIVIITGQGEGQSGIVDFSGAEILVVNQ